MRELYTLLFIIHSFIVVSQTNANDSIQAAWNNENTKEQIEWLHQQVKATWTNDSHQSKIYAEEALALANDFSDKRLLAISYRLYGGVYNYLSKIDSGRYYKSKALAIALELQDSLLLAPTYNNLGVTAQTIGNHIEALEYFYKSYLIAKNLPEFPHVSTIIANISEVYYDLKMYDSATYYATEAVYLTESSPNSAKHLLPKIWLARAQLANDNLDEARNALSEIIRIGEAIGEKRYTA